MAVHASSTAAAVALTTSVGCRCICLLKHRLVGGEPDIGLAEGPPAAHATQVQVVQVVHASAGIQLQHHDIACTLPSSTRVLACPHQPCVALVQAAQQERRGLRKVCEPPAQARSQCCCPHSPLPVKQLVCAGPLVLRRGAWQVGVHDEGVERGHNCAGLGLGRDAGAGLLQLLVIHNLKQVVVQPARHRRGRACNNKGAARSAAS